MATERQRRGLHAESAVAEHLADLGWTVLARNVRVGRDEIDVVAVDPGPPRELVLVEVRSARAAAFGPPEERVDRRKVRRLYRARAAFVAAGMAPAECAGLATRVDLVIVDRRSGMTVIRQLRNLEPP
ncbi:MAG: YraN family protein [Chloroflexota bacterium]|nr:YraN family protein [Chloroflexota bacterium]